MKEIITNVFNLNLNEEMAKRADSLKKVRVPYSDIKETIDGILSYIDAYNQLSKYDTRVLGRDFKDVIVLEEFKDFLEPASVQIDPADLECEELLLKGDDDAESAFLDKSYNEYLDLCSKFRGYFKKDISTETVTLDVMRKFVSWSEVSQIAAYEVMYDDESTGLVVRYNDGKPYIPLHISDFMRKGWKSRHFNASLEEILEDYVETWLV